MLRKSKKNIKRNTNKKNSNTIEKRTKKSSNAIENAKKKLLTKNLDMIISNDISDKSIGFDVDDNEVNVITKDETLLLKKDKKIRIAREIFKIIASNI